jgi:hypothetical protein
LDWNQIILATMTFAESDGTCSRKDITLPDIFMEPTKFQIGVKSGGEKPRPTFTFTESRRNACSLG